MAMEKPHGWASLTRLRNDATCGSVPPDPFPTLGAAPAGPRRGAAVLQAPFVSVASKGLPTATARANDAALSPEDAAVARLLAHYGWADEVLVRDVLRAVDGDEGMADAQLHAMAGAESPKAHAENDGVGGDDSRSTGAVECEDNDVYLKFRREALRLSRYVKG